MRDFLAKHQYLVVWVSALIIVGAFAVLIIQLNGIIPALPSPTGSPRLAPPVVIPPPPAPPAPPSVTFTIQKGKGGNSFFVQWQNLPDGTVALRIYRGKTNTDPSAWSLWKVVSLTGKDLSNGDTSIDLGNSSEDGFSFRVEAVGDNGGGDNSTSTPILWQSSSTIPIVTTSTPQGPVNQTPPSEPSSTPVSQSTSSNPTPPPPPNNSSTPSGTPYYNPEIQISSYGQGQSGTFWVQHVDQKIEIGWQNLPAATDQLVIMRSQNQAGPWTTILTQENPAGAYSIQIVDNTESQVYYYQMNAMSGGTILQTYGPVLLESN